MGCCKSKYKKNSIFLHAKANINDYVDKDSQSKKLYDALDQIETEIQLIKEGKYQSPSTKKQASKSERFFFLRKRSCYLSQLVIFVRWTIKVHQVNQPDRRFDEIIAQISILLDNNDEFLINSLENKIRHILISKKN